MTYVAAIIVAAGRGTRAGGDLPKQFRQIGGEVMLKRTLLMFLEHQNVGAVQPVINPEDGDLYSQASAGLGDERLLAPAVGGASGCAARSGRRTGGRGWWGRHLQPPTVPSTRLADGLPARPRPSPRPPIGLWDGTHTGGGGGVARAAPSGPDERRRRRPSLPQKGGVPRGGG